MTAQSGSIHSAAPAGIPVRTHVRQIDARTVDISIAVGDITTCINTLLTVEMLGTIVPCTIFPFTTGTGDSVSAFIIQN